MTCALLETSTFDSMAKPLTQAGMLCDLLLDIALLKAMRHSIR